MSSHHKEKISNKHAVHGDVNLISTLSKDFGAMYLSDEYSDVTLIVCGERFNSHKIVLAARSQYFRALLSGGFKESRQQEIELKDASLDGFKCLLEYIYTGRLFLRDKPDEVTLDILRLAHIYEFSELETSISTYFNEILNINNVCLMFNAALLYGLEFLTRDCHEYMDKHAREVMKHESFLKLSPGALNNLLSRDSLCAPEIDIFVAVQAWLKANPDDDSKSILDKIRLSRMSITDLLNVVRDSGLFSAEAILNAMRARKQKHRSDLNYRSHSLIGVNVADLSHGAEVLRGEYSEYLLNGDTTNYNDDEGYTSHAITASTEGILVKLGTQYLINHIKMLLWDRDRRLYCYYVEVSIDQKNWVRVIDYRDYFCRSWQYLYFDPRAVRYIRIVGTTSTGFSKGFRLVSFEAYYTKHTERHRDGFVIPTQNVATIQKGATVVAFNKFGDLDCLINGDTSNYDQESGFVESSYIQVQFRQPYIIDSVRLLLWDLDNKEYAYKIDVSGNYSNWIVVADKTDKYYRSWQTIRFNAPRPAVYVRITGTCTRTDKLLRIVHFECPAQENDKVTSESTTQIGKR